MTEGATINGWLGQKGAVVSRQSPREEWLRLSPGRPKAWGSWQFPSLVVSDQNRAHSLLIQGLSLQRSQAEREWGS